MCFNFSGVTTYLSLPTECSAAFFFSRRNVAASLMHEIVTRYNRVKVIHRALSTSVLRQRSFKNTLTKFIRPRAITARYYIIWQKDTKNINIKIRMTEVKSVTYIHINLQEQYYYEMQRDRAMRYISWNLVICCTAIRKVAFEQAAAAANVVYPISDIGRY